MKEAPRMTRGELFLMWAPILVPVAGDRARCLQRRVAHAIISLSLSVALASCSSELSTEDAEAALMAHLREIAPRAMNHEVPDSVVSAGEILESDEHTRDVRFTITGTPATGVFQRGQEGWVLT